MTHKYTDDEAADHVDHRNLGPSKHIQPSYRSGKVRILKPADPELIKKYRAEQRAIGDKRVAAGLARMQERMVRK